MRTKLYIAGVFVLLVACSRVTKPERQQLGATQVVRIGRAEMTVPSSLVIRPTADETRRNLDNDLDENDLDKPGEYRVSVTTDVPRPCAPSLTGASQTEQLANANGEAEWGKVTLLNAYDAYIDAVCRPFTEGCTHRDIFEGTCKTNGGAYAFCAEKDGKTVVICISQTTDNSEQARQIFETFRWTE